MPDFTSLGLSPAVLRALDELGYEEPSPIQRQAIPILLSGRDLVGQAVTGTGKTAAFGIPIVERIDPEQEGIQAVVLAPTRELAVQVAEQIYRIGRHRPIRVVPIYGGQPIDRQIRALRGGIHVVVATPGRLLDHIGRGTVDLGQVRMVVLDEADEMLNMGFLEDIESILTAVAGGRQTALFSATMPDPIRRLAGRFLDDPETIQLGRPRGMSAPTVDQRYYEVPGRHKLEALVRILDVDQPEHAIVFCGTKRAVDEVAESLQARGYRAEALHGDMIQAQRDRAIRALREGRVELLVATDVAARGLDVEQVSHVINYDLPQDPEYYVHRIGRTGRYGRSGHAITLVTPWEMREFRIIERIVGTRVRRAEIPTAAELAERERELLAERVLQTLQQGDWSRYRQVVEDLASDHDPVDVAAAAVAMAEKIRERNSPRPSSTGEGASELEAWLRTPRNAHSAQRNAPINRRQRPGAPPRKRQRFDGRQRKGR